ncbi:MAG: efflux RND transporter periplasmic adaptor subunit [Spirochaetaceae bacterium]|jgi:multidrug efflux pump subunit AcrA (membrane-fusion protein)|nr:efflux RND transporter periplasmic adaptor subunit [Spirochaetaceae bacterium]
MRTYDTKQYASFIILFLIIGIVCPSCSEKNKNENQKIKTVKVTPVQLKSIADEVNGFGSLSVLKKFEVWSAQDGVLKKLYFREGEEVRAGQLLAVLDNQQIDLAVARAENTLSQAYAALKRAQAALLEGEFNAEAQLLSLEKADAQMIQVWKAYQENERKFDAQHTLYLAGGVNEESVRAARFSLENELAQIRLTEKEIEIQRIGFRDRDLIAAGKIVPESKEEKTKAFIELATIRALAELAGARSYYEACEKELQSAIIVRDDLKIKSPASGIVVNRLTEEGERIKRDDKILTIIETQSLYLTIAVQEADAFRLKKGMKALVRLGISAVYEGSVDMISPVADSQSFSFSVRILLPKEVLSNSALLNVKNIQVTDESESKEYARPGMFARVSISTGGPQQVLTIKENALVNKKNNEAYCFVVIGKMIATRKLLLGSSLEDEYIVLAGLQEGEICVLHPEAGLQEGDYVSFIE